MNIKFKFLTCLLIATSLFTFSSCEKDLYEQNIQNSSRNISVSDASLSKLDKKTSLKINEKISLLLEKKNKSNLTNKFEYNNTLGVYIDTENGKLVSNDGQLFYTFPMFRKSEDNIENIVFKPINTGEIETYLVKYNIKPEEFVELTNSQIHNLNQTVQKVLYEDDHVIIEQVCADLYNIETIYSSWELNEGNGNPSSSTTNEVFITSFCSYNYTYLNTNGGGGSPPAGSSTSTDNGQVPGTVGIGSNNGISTIVVLSPQQILIKDFVRSLTPTQLEWYNNNPESQQSINDAITSVQENGSNTTMILQMIDLCIANHSSFVIDNSLTAQNALVFDNVNQFQNFLNSNQNGIGTDFQSSQIGDTKISSVKIEYPTYSIKIDVKQQFTPTYEVISVNSYKTGVTYLLSYEQKDFTKIKSGNNEIIDVYGTITYGVKIGSWDGLSITVDVHYQIIINRTNGEIISAIQVP